MKRWIASVTIVLSIVATGSAYAQEASAGPGKMEVTIIPGGWTQFTKNTASSESSFGTYNLGGAVSYNFNRLIGIEGEVGGSLGVTQNLLTFTGPDVRDKTPDMLAYSGNVVVNAPTKKVVPYVTGGIGGLHQFRRETLGVMDSTTFFTGNVGGGVKWFAPNARWGLRGDYRLEIVNGKPEASSFFGQNTRYGNRIYGAVIINAVK